MTDSEFDSVVQVARMSVLWRLITWVADRWTVAWSSSAVVRTLRQIGTDMASWSIETRTRAAALAVAWGGIGYAISLPVLPRYATSGLPWSWVASVIVVSLIVAAFPRAFAIAARERFGSRQKSAL